VPTGPQWAHEVKHDGFHFIVRREGDKVRVFARTGRECSKSANVVPIGRCIIVR
jgi:bifunctional non-homologous end joining protein LigD